MLFKLYFLFSLNCFDFGPPYGAWGPHVLGPARRLDVDDLVFLDRRKQEVSDVSGCQSSHMYLASSLHDPRVLWHCERGCDCDVCVDPSSASEIFDCKLAARPGPMAWTQVSIEPQSGQRLKEAVAARKQRHKELVRTAHVAHAD